MGKPTLALVARLAAGEPWVCMAEPLEFEHVAVCFWCEAPQPKRRAFVPDRDSHDPCCPWVEARVLLRTSGRDEKHG